MSPAAGPARPKRRDAAANADRLVQAAREVFAQRGLSATLEDIAQHAGVGVGTVYRNFASKREIVARLYDDTLRDVMAEVRPALQIDDPWLALVTFFEIAATHQAQDRGLCETLLGQNDLGGPAGIHPEAATALLAELTPLFDRARGAGVLRDGVTATDVGPIFMMLEPLYRLGAGRSELWRRYLAVVLDGLRAEGRRALPVAGLDAEGFAAVVSGEGAP
ncbi:hypothetical protein AX769_11310 [Frondihabitans sp. PAMC 28766]|uniref:TetR/AcrR family transcriptional regulator n=1 Tax=Frondihabitans sp. PAMC 28766 TaxID=1795630 RepID=UPI00078D117B|nr:TetR/AcrR family transcriptional regulator [Frondihabitans sp. PAMC 28766]AMM20620.1 hypothetical protein AX769_11310 [Frondihabitans sp. PAMC 28766]